MRSSAVLVAGFACCLLAATGCARPPDGQNGEKILGQETKSPAIKHWSCRSPNWPGAEPVRSRYGGPNWPPPVWLVSGEEAVQTSYGEFCVSDMCAGEVVPQQIEDDPVTAELPAGDSVMVVVGGPSAGRRRRRRWGRGRRDRR